MQSGLTILPVTSGPSDPMVAAKTEPRGEGARSFEVSFAASHRGEGDEASPGDAGGVALPLAAWTGMAMLATPAPAADAEMAAELQANIRCDEGGVTAESEMGLGGVATLPALKAEVTTGNPAPAHWVATGRHDPADAEIAAIGTTVVDTAIVALQEVSAGKDARTGGTVEDEAGSRANAGLLTERLPVKDAPGATRVGILEPGAVGQVGGSALDADQTPRPPLLDGTIRISPTSSPKVAISFPLEAGPTRWLREPGTDAAALTKSPESTSKGPGGGQEAEGHPEPSPLSKVKPVVPKVEPVTLAVSAPVGPPAARLPQDVETVPSTAMPQPAFAPAVLGAPSSAPPERLRLSPSSDIKADDGTMAEPTRAKHLLQGKTPGFWERFFTDLQRPEVCDTNAASVPTEPTASQTTDAVPGSEGEALVKISTGPITGPSDQSGKAGYRDHSGKLDIASAPASVPASTGPTQATPDQSLRLVATGGVGPAVKAAIADMREDQIDIFPLSLGGVQGGLSFATAPGPVSTSPFPVLTGGTAPRVASQIAEQLAGGLVVGSGGATEFALSPDELGHVRLRMEPDAANPDRMVVMITFERPETLDLFRRHAGDLADALRVAGYAGADIGFGQDSGGRFGSDRRESQSDHRFNAATGPASADPVELAPRLMAGASLDLRL
jgi:hypothetical protein